MADPPIDLIRSKRRKRTIEATLVDGRLQIRAPHGLSRERETELIVQARERMKRKVYSNQVDLLARAQRLADRYDLPRPARVEWWRELRHQNSLRGGWNPGSPGTSEPYSVMDASRRRPSADGV